MSNPRPSRPEARPAGEVGVRASERERRRWRRGWVIGIVGTILLHLAVFLIRGPVVDSPPVAVGQERVGEIALGGGAGQLEQVEVRIQPEEEPEEVVPVPAEVPEIEIEIEPEELPDVQEGVPEVGRPEPGRGTGTGADEGPATGPGDPEGSGSGAGAARPVPRGMILPPSGAPASMRGQEMTVWVFVTTGGRVDPDSTRLEPPTPDRGYNRSLLRSAAEWRFDPARRNGEPVAAWYPYQIVF